MQFFFGMLAVLLLVVIWIRLEKVMDDVSKLDAAVATLTTDVDALITKPQSSVQPAIDAATQAVADLDAKVKTALGA